MALHWLTERGVTFTWISECENALSFLKTQLTSAPSWLWPFILDTDAHNTGIGAVLFQMQEDVSECVVAYTSRVLRNYCITRSRDEGSCWQS